MNEIIIQMRVSFLKQFDHYVWNTLAEDTILALWLAEGVPDGADYDDLLEIARDNQEWEWIVRVFERCCKLGGVIK